MRHCLHFTLFAVIILTLNGCGGGSSSGSTVEDSELRTLISMHGLSGDPSIGRTLPSIESPLSKLGMKLFFSKDLGGDQDSACVTCHHPALGGGDALSLSRGVGAVNPDLLGPGRLLNDESAGPNVPRNAPTTFNAGMWDKGMFWDYRVESALGTAGTNGSDSGIRTPDTNLGVADASAGTNIPTAQARFPVTSAEEMKGESFAHGQSNQAVRNMLAQRLSAKTSWGAEFLNVFGDSAVSYHRIAAALGEYERSQVFVDTPWREYVQGNDGAISVEAKRGALTFFRSVEEGGANCATCHSGDFFTDETFHVTGMPQIGRGKGDGNTGDDDFGRARETGASADRYAFRTPTLLNVELTGPYGHTGAYTTLEGVVRHMLNPEQAFLQYQTSQLEAGIPTGNLNQNTSAAIAQLKAQQLSGESKLTNVELDDQQIDELVEFLKTLTDRCARDRGCLSKWVPQREEDQGGELNLIFAVGENGGEL